jgi:hypothetical protein
MMNTGMIYQIDEELIAVGFRTGTSLYVLMRSSCPNNSHFERLSETNETYFHAPPQSIREHFDEDVRILKRGGVCVYPHHIATAALAPPSIPKTLNPENKQELGAQ